ncbi:MAG: sialate O-acetylesterase [Bacteroidales bacterium]|nr:sialate O-acetylesterase [Bacteroidales bacterium]
MKNKYFLNHVVIVFLLLALNSRLTNATIKLPAIFSDNMILQQQSSVPVWGWAKSNVNVTVKTSWDGKIYSTKADQSGKWKLKVSTPKASETSYSITISDGKPLMLENVLIGEVWVCSGQSNMEMQMKGRINQPTEGSLNDVLHAANKNIRLFTLAVNPATTPQDTCSGTWLEATPASVYEFSAVAYYFGHLLNEVTNIPVGLIHTSLGGSRVEAWMTSNAMQGINKPLPAKDMIIKNPQTTPTVLFNGMINPILGYGIRGAIWYQGESNREEPDLYLTMFVRMVKEWRDLWGVGEFPFYYAQIAPYHYVKTLNSALLREAQLKAMSLIPHSAMAVNMDANSPECIHPPRKKLISERLAYLALGKTYGIKGFPCTSPDLKSYEVKGSVVELTFEMPGNMGLTSFDKEIKGFVVAGSNKRFYPAAATISGNKVLVVSPNVTNPVAVRYAFEDVATAELFSLDGLPVSSFRTDTWEVK